MAVVMEDAAQAGLDAELAAFEAARKAGPEALLALVERLSPAALDLAMADLVEAREQLADAAPPPPEQPVLDLAQEQAALEAMAEQEVAHRAVALTDFGDPAEGHATDASTAAPLSITAPAVPAANRTVGSSCTYATITAAIAASSPGDTLLIEGGRTFVENVTVPVTLTLQGGYAGCASGSTARTTIDGNALGSVIVVNRAISVTLRNLNVTNGATGFEGGGVQFAWGNGTGRLALYNVFIYGNTGQWGGGLWVGQNAEVIGQAVAIYSNTATAYGGGVRLFGSRATFTDSSIYGNSAPLGGGIHATQEDVYVPVVDLVNSDVYGNQAVTGSGLGGGVYLRQGSVLATDCADIYQNEALQGGGAYLITSTLTIQGSCSEISFNSATGNGGGVYAQGSTVNLDEDAELYDNTAGTSGAGNGGAAYLDDSDMLGDKALIHYNAADDYGGGVYATHGSLLDMDLGGYACFRARCSRLSNNTSTTL
ncbi:MAG: hypothetical protein MUF84_12175, partial [Anaerolineae bacterium]|nr:hypothetical protein [Anaerolineae bacterium]